MEEGGGRGKGEVVGWGRRRRRREVTECMGVIPVASELIVKRFNFIFLFFYTRN